MLLLMLNVRKPIRKGLKKIPFKIGKPCRNFFPSYYLKKSSLSFSHVVLLFEANANLTIGHFHLMSH